MGLVSRLFLAIFVLLMAILLNVAYHSYSSRIPEKIEEKSLARTINGFLALKYFSMKVFGTRWVKVAYDWFIHHLTIRSRPDDPKLMIEDTVMANVPVRIYRYKHTSKSLSPAIVMFHGGGWTFFTNDVVDGLCTRMVQQKPELVIVSVTYRTAPEHIFPAAYEDCLDVTKHVIKEAEKLGVDSSRVAVMGDSAGGNLAAAISQTHPQLIKLQVLIYPALQAIDLSYPSYFDNADVLPAILNPESMTKMWLRYAGHNTPDIVDEMLKNEHTSVEFKESRYFQKYANPYVLIKDKAMRKKCNMSVENEKLRSIKKGNSATWKKLEPILLDTRFAPLMADSLKNLPRAYILVAGHDILREDGLLYYYRLLEAEVKAHLAFYPDAFHGFFPAPAHFKLSSQAVDDLVKYLKNYL